LNSKSPSEDRINILKEPEKDYEAGKDSFKKWHEKLKSNREVKESDMANELEERGVEKLLKCSTCGREVYQDEIVLPENRIVYDMCSVCSDKKAEMIDKQTRELRSNYFDSIIPPRYLSVGVKDSSNSKILNSDGCILFGGYGTGKTWNSYSVAKKLYIDGTIEEFKIITEIGMINELKSGFNDQTFDSKISNFKSVDLLVVDEMGKSNDTDFNKAQLFEILNHRYDWMKRTILICNAKEISELHEILSPAILDRFRECIIEMSGESKRYHKT